MELEKIKCSICKGEMPKLRLDKFGYNFCVVCSTVTPKKGVSFSLGTGEDTWEETIIMDDATYKNYLNTQNAFEKMKKI